MNRNDEVQLLSQYYYNQASQNGFGNIYQGVVYQRGHGIGSLLSGLFRLVLPVLKKTGSMLGREVLKGASGVLADTDNNVRLTKSLMNRGVEAVTNTGRQLLNGMAGSGYNTNGLSNVSSQSSAGRSKRRTYRKSKSAKKVKKVNKTKIVKRKAKGKKKKGVKKSTKSALFAKRFNYF